MCFADENRVGLYDIFFNIFGEKGGKILGFLGLKTLMLISFFLYIIKVTFDNKKITTKRHRVVHYLKKKKKKKKKNLPCALKTLHTYIAS
jgi:hypothetical protein